MFIITGYTNGLFKENEDMSNLSIFQKLRSEGVNFIIALFDNMYGPDVHYSKKGMTEFYQSIFAMGY